MIWTGDGWCGYGVPWTGDGWPRVGQPWTGDGFVADSGDPAVVSDVGGPLFRDPKKRKILHLPDRPDIRERLLARKIKFAEDLATTAVAQALADAERLQAEEQEAQRIAAADAARERYEKTRKAAEEKALAAAVQKREREEKAKAEAIAEARRIATAARVAAEKHARVVAVEEAQRAADERTLEEFTSQMLKDLTAEDARVIAGLEKIIPMLAAELDELDRPEAKSDEATPVQLAALEALQAILETTRRIH